VKRSIAFPAPRPHNRLVPAGAFAMKSPLLFAALLLCLPIAAASGQARRHQPAPTAQEPTQIDAVIRCRSIADAGQRLQCFDTAASALAQATERREIVVVDRSQVRETRRRLFGFALPDIRLFGGGDDDDHDQDAVRELQATVTSATRDGHGHWIVTLNEGGTWSQTDNLALGIWPRRGSTVVIRRQTLGNYMMRVDGQPGIRVRRTG
jgi:hypothetical protein